MGGVCLERPQQAYEFLAAHGPDGKLGDCVEITALLNDWSIAQPIREVRRQLYGASRWAATTTLPVAKDLPEGSPFSMEVIAYGGGASYAVSPSWMYDLSHMVLSPAVVQPVGGGDLIHLSGVVSWDQDGRVLYPDDAEAQVRQVLDYTSRLLRESGSALSDLIRVRTFTSDPRVGRILQGALKTRAQGASCAHHVIASLDPSDLGQLVCEVQFLAVRDAPRQWSLHGSQVVLGGLKHLHIAPLKSALDCEAIPMEQEADEVVRELEAVCQSCGLKISNIVSLLVEVADRAAGEALTGALDRISGGTFRAGITASVNRKVAERIRRRIVLTGTAIGD